MALALVERALAQSLLGPLQQLCPIAGFAEDVRITGPQAGEPVHAFRGALALVIEELHAADGHGQLGLDSQHGCSQFRVQPVGHLGLGFAGGNNLRMIGRHAALQHRGPQLCIDQPVFQPPQGRLRFQEAARRGQQLCRIGLGVLEQVQQLPVGFRGGAELAELVFDLRDRAAERRVAGVGVQQRAELRQVAAHILFQGGQPGGGGTEVGPGHLHGLFQLVDHAVGLGVADLLQVVLQLPADGTAQRRDALTVLVADLQVENLRGAEFHALGRHDLHGLLQILNVGVAGKGRRFCTFGRRPHLDQRGAEHLAALGKLDDRLLDALEILRAAEAGRVGIAADGLVADDDRLRRLPRLRRQQGVGRGARRNRQRGKQPAPPVREQQPAERLGLGGRVLRCVHRSCFGKRCQKSTSRGAWGNRAGRSRDCLSCNWGKKLASFAV